jgi:hypothetical protein
MLKKWQKITVNYFYNDFKQLKLSVLSRCVVLFHFNYFSVGFPFYGKKLFTRNIVSDVTDGYYVGIAVVST